MATSENIQSVVKKRTKQILCIFFLLFMRRGESFGQFQMIRAFLLDNCVKL